MKIGGVTIQDNISTVGLGSDILTGDVIYITDEITSSANLAMGTSELYGEEGLDTLAGEGDYILPYRTSYIDCSDYSKTDFSNFNFEFFGYSVSMNEDIWNL